MPRATIEYMNRRRALMPASGGAKQNRAVEYCPDRDLDPCDRLELQTDSAWSDYRIRADIMWQQIFARFGLELTEHSTATPYQSETEIPF